MKRCFVAGVTLCALALGSSDLTFGPKKCVTISRSSQGSCVLTTNCEGADTSKTEFAFDCIGKHVVRHSFGVGGFDADEEFDTDVKCDRCDLPSPADGLKAKAVAVKAAQKLLAQPLKAAPFGSKFVHAILKGSNLVTPFGAAAPEVTQVKPVNLKIKAAKATTILKKTKSTKAFGAKAPTVSKAILKKTKPFKAFGSKTKTVYEAKPVQLNANAKVVSNVKATSATAAKAKAKFWPLTPTKAPVEVVKYGPDGCVSVHRGKAGHCIMETDCEKKDLSDYEFGLVCVDKVGSPVKHMFGKGSFDSKESFDTLITCEECLGLEEIPDSITLAGEVAIMGKDIANLKAVMQNISTNVQMLNQEVFKPAGGPAPAPAPMAASPAAAKKGFIQEAATGMLNHKRHLRRHHHHHHHHHHDDDEDGQ